MLFRSHILGKSFIGGQRALENRLIIKHLTSAQHSAGFEGDLNTAISRIVDEKKRQIDINREKRLVIKHQTQETKYSLEESIVRSKVQERSCLKLQRCLNERN